MSPLPLDGRVLRIVQTIALTLIALAGPARTAAGQSFAAPLYPLDYPAQDIVTLDLDAAGGPDLAVLAGEQIDLLRALPGGGYETTDVIATGDFGGRLRVADMDLDGNDDLVLSSYGHLQMFFLWNGFVVFSWDYPSPGYGLDVGDLDGDGDTDTVVIDIALDQFTVRLGLGSSGMGPPVSYPTGDNPGESALGDLDRDGALDVVVVEPNGHSISARLGDGAGGFGPALTHRLTDSPFRLKLADLNGDGALDAVVTMHAVVQPLLGDGAGGFTDGVTQSLPNDVGGVEIHDLDGDGAQDLVVSLAAPGFGLAVLRGTGDGGFAPPVSQFEGFDLRALHVEDLDQDGHPDLASGLDAPFLQVARGDGDGGFVDAGSLSLPSPAKLVAVADLNGDGLSDLVSAPSSVDVTEVRLGLGDAEFGPPVSSPVAAIDVARFGDFDGDGLDDLVTVAGVGVTVRLSDGAGGLLPGVPTPVPDIVTDVGVADWNGDGDLDVVVLTYSIPTGSGDYKRWIGVLPGDGAGGLAPPPGMFQYDLGYPQILDRLKLGDVNGDALPDAVVIESYPGKLRVLLGDGAVWFIAGTVISETMLSNEGTDSMALADLDGDGALDIVARRASQIRAWDGQGDGTFAPGVTLTTAALDGVSMAVDDVDQDGFADVVFDSYSRFGVLHGSAGGEFELADYGRPTTFPSGRIFVGSLDGDAWPDVIGVDTDGALWPAEPKLLGVSLHTNLTASAHWADLGYGLAGTNGVPQLVGSGTLQAGSPGTLKLSNAHPNKLAVLFISKQSNPSPFKGGILATVPPLISFMLVTSPIGAINLSWTNWPGGALGSTWYFQYGVVDPGGPAGAALSNAVRATQP